MSAEAPRTYQDGANFPLPITPSFSPDQGDSSGELTRSRSLPTWRKGLIAATAFASGLTAAGAPSLADAAGFNETGAGDGNFCNDPYIRAQIDDPKTAIPDPFADIRGKTASTGGVSEAQPQLHQVRITLPSGESLLMNLESCDPSGNEWPTDLEEARKGWMEKGNLDVKLKGQYSEYPLGLTNVFKISSENNTWEINLALLGKTRTESGQIILLMGSKDVNSDPFTFYIRYGDEPEKDVALQEENSINGRYDVGERMITAEQAFSELDQSIGEGVFSRIYPNLGDGNENVQRINKFAPYCWRLARFLDGARRKSYKKFPRFEGLNESLDKVDISRTPGTLILFVRPNSQA